MENVANHPAVDALNQHQLIELAKAEKETGFFYGTPPVFLIEGEPVTREHFIATTSLAQMSPKALELIGQTGTRRAEVIGNFLDLLKGLGIVVTGEGTLRNDLATVVDWKRRLAVWIEYGRFYGVAFHISATGHNKKELFRLFSDAGMSSKHFLMHLRHEPVGEVQ